MAILGVPRESFPGERRVALVPEVVARLGQAGFEVAIESAAGLAAGFADCDYAERGARVLPGRAELLAVAEVVAQVRTLAANRAAFPADLALLRAGQLVIGLAEPDRAQAELQALASRGVDLVALDRVPRLSRAQSMDVLSSMATVAGYKAVILAAGRLGRMFPMLMTAGGTVTPARVLVIGAGVAGLQAIATARRLGALVSAYDLRPAVREQVESLGARFVEVGIEAPPGPARPPAPFETVSGHARELAAEVLESQRRGLAPAVAQSDVVVSTAAVPGRPAPLLLSAAMVRAMRPGSVVVDLAAERGGNCELTRPGGERVEGGVVILGPLDLPSSVAADASSLFARNLANLLVHLAPGGKLDLDRDDEVVRAMLVVRRGQVLPAGSGRF